MKVFGANMNYQVSDFFNENLKALFTFEQANEKIYQSFGIRNFFENNEDLKILKKSIAGTKSLVKVSDRAEYGDFQTNMELANKSIHYLSLKNISPHILIEPTCGKGNFITASLGQFSELQKVFGIEIYKPYVWECKFNIINFYLKNAKANKPDILIIHTSVFDFNFKNIAKEYSGKKILVIGNPPWVTNSKLGSLNSGNLPKKGNFKNHNGLDAITGKGNFDIAEYITLRMIDAFQKTNGDLALLVKNTVIKNIVFDQQKNKYQISNIEKHRIDSKREFNVSVGSSLFYCKLNDRSEFHCKEFNFYNNKESISKFGWLGNKFVSNIDTYALNKNIDGNCPFIWRQGLKHDCSMIMELKKANGYYVNGLSEEIKLEDDLVYGILKSSDLKNKVINQTKKFTIVTQKKVGQETKYIKKEYPQTYQYLIEHKKNFNARKSSIYKNKPLFSIFGIGSYSFKPYKVAISGLYKTFHFTLVLSQNNKSIMLDDTCYMIGFDKIEYASYTFILLNLKQTTRFLQSITFSDAKRIFTKDILMRIDILELAKTINKKELESKLEAFNEIYKLNLTLDLWDSFLKEMTPIENRQMELFAL